MQMKVCDIVSDPVIYGNCVHEVEKQIVHSQKPQPQDTLPSSNKVSCIINILQGSLLPLPRTTHAISIPVPSFLCKLGKQRFSSEWKGRGQHRQDKGASSIFVSSQVVWLMFLKSCSPTSAQAPRCLLDDVGENRSHRTMLPCVYAPLWMHNVNLVHLWRNVGENQVNRTTEDLLCS